MEESADCSSTPQDTNITGSKVSAEVKSTNYTVTSSFSLYILQLDTSVLASAAPSFNNPAQTNEKYPTSVDLSTDL